MVSGALVSCGTEIAALGNLASTYNGCNSGSNGDLDGNKKSNKGKGGNSSNHMFGENGTQVDSKTVWQNGKTERIDIENPAPGERPGQIHYHDSNNTKWYIDTNEMQVYNQKTGELAPKSVQKILQNKDVIKAIQKGLKILGE